MYIYFKGVAILLRALIEKVGEEENASGFVDGVGEVSAAFFCLISFLCSPSHSRIKCKGRERS